MFIRYFSMTLEASVMLVDSTYIQYLCTLVRVQALHHFDNLYDELGSTNLENLKNIILGLGT